MALLWAVSPSAAAAPPNDDFENATALTTGVPAGGSNVDATAQEGEPVHSTWVASNRSVWFTWTAPQNGLARVSACGSSFDTVVAVYGGAALGGIYATRIANNDNGCGAAGNDASLAFLTVRAGTTYRIVLDGWTYSDAGDYEIVAGMAADAAPPPNDDVGAAAELRGADLAVTGTNAGATSGWNEWPSRATQLVWWHWVSPVNGQVRVDTCASGFDTVLGVMRRDGGEWAGGDIAHDGCGDRGMVTLNAVEGREYWIGVGGDAGASGAIDLRIDATPDVTAPTTTITSGPSATWGRRIADIAWSVQDDAATTSECALDEGPWHSCTAAEQLSGLAEGEHVFQVRSTDQYGNAEYPGEMRRFTVAIPTAPNDDFAAATSLLPGIPVSVNNGKAMAEPGELSHDAWYYAQRLSANFSVWFTFAAAADGTAELDWCASEFDVTLAVYTGDRVDALTRVAQRDEGCQESFEVTRGVTYHAAIDGLARNRDYGTGPISLTLNYRGSDPDPDPAPGQPDASPSQDSSQPGPAEPSPSATAGQAELRLAAHRPAATPVDRRGRFRVRGAWVACNTAGPCIVLAKVVSQGGDRRLGAGTLRLAPGGSRAVQARLTRSARTLLARRHRLRARVRLTLSPGRTRTASVTLVAPRRAGERATVSGAALP
jgi:hypothetical protein